MTTITRENFTAALEAAVEERGADFVYDRTLPGWSTKDRHTADPVCVYQLPDGTPACIIGVALSKIDPDLVPAHANDDGAVEVLKNRGVTDRDLAYAASTAQQAQDKGATWGEALAAFKERISA